MAQQFNRDYIHVDFCVLQKIFNGNDFACSIYEAERTEVILGRSRKKQEDLFINNCIKDGIPVLRRSGGGGTVVLSRGMIIISIAGKSSLPFHLRDHMTAVNRMVIGILEDFNIKNLSIKGISDIALGDKKVLGSSLYRRKDTVLYQGSLLVNPDLSLISRYLKHPCREPAYRKGRSHAQFLTSLHNEGYRIKTEIITGALRREFQTKQPWPTVYPSNDHQEE